MIPVRSYYRIMAGAKSVFARQWYEEGFIAGDWGIEGNLSCKLSDDWREFNQQCIPLYQQAHPGKSKVAAGLCCGMLYTISKGIQIGDIILTPDGNGTYYVGEVISEYFYIEGEQPHRRKVKWYTQGISRNEISQSLRNSAGSIGTVCNLTKYAQELETLLISEQDIGLTHSDETVEDPSVFALEKHLEDFLVANWASTDLGREYNIYTVDGDVVGQQYPSDTGAIDILAVSKDGKTLLVVELKRGRASDVVVGQIQRYMGYVKDELAEADQQVKGIIIALEDDLRLRRALSVAPTIRFYRYQVSFKLINQ